MQQPRDEAPSARHRQYGQGGHGAHVQDASLESLAALVGLRGGYALVPALARERLASKPELTVVPLEGAEPGRQIALYWREASPWHADIQAFAALLQDVARGRPGLVVEPVG